MEGHEREMKSQAACAEIARLCGIGQAFDLQNGRLVGSFDKHKPLQATVLHSGNEATLKQQHEAISIIAVYAAFPEEIRLDPLIDACYAAGVRVAFPCMNVKGAYDLPMYMREVKEGFWRNGSAPFAENPLKRFAEDDPSLTAFPIVAPDEIGAIVVPLVGFDEQCNRLGYGGGNYDAYLSRLSPSCAVVGVGFAEQMVEHVPTEPHDIALPAIVFA